jgi:O-6-methylguanine DNA methyltransferase
LRFVRHLRAFDLGKNEMTRQTLQIRGIEIEIALEDGALRVVTAPREVPRNLDRETLQAIEGALSKYKPVFRGVSNFRRHVWERMMKIPRGKTMTYSELAAAVGKPKAARAVGSAVGANPLLLVVPCHRIVGKNGLGGFQLGLAWKKKLLELETEKSA